MAAFRRPVASEDKKLSTAVALLEKARSTSFVGENEALVLKAYRLVAAYLNSVTPAGSPAARRRERRLLEDRRQAGLEAQSVTDPAPRPSQPEGAATYRQVFESDRHQEAHLDLTL